MIQKFDWKNVGFIRMGEYWLFYFLY